MNLYNHMDIKEIAYLEAIEVLKKCSTKNGFFAAYPGYDAVWGRDSMIISLGASIVEGDSYKKKFMISFENSLITLSKKQSKLGQIPNAVDIFSKRKPHVDFGSIDSTLWFIFGNYLFKKRYNRFFLKNKNDKNVKLALNWLEHQDFGEKTMLVQLPTTDWQDAFPHRYGYTINTQALYYYILLIMNKKVLANKLKNIVNDKHEGLWNGEFYLPWRWKNHNKYKEKGEWFDSLGNILAIIFDLADKKKAEKIFSYIKKKKIAYPYPIKAIYPPILKNSKDWEDYFNDCDAKVPYHYLNGGIWTYIGGFYVLALIKYKKFSEAEKQLELLAKANIKNDSMFSEWLNGKTGKPYGGKNQGWNAAMYLLAYNSFKKKKVLL